MATQQAAHLVLQDGDQLAQLVQGLQLDDSRSEQVVKQRA